VGIFCFEKDGRCGYVHSYKKVLKHHSAPMIIFENLNILGGNLEVYEKKNMFRDYGFWKENRSINRQNS